MLTNNTHTRWGMDVLAVLESASLSMCSIATLLWMSIGTFSRAVGGEEITQRVIAILCVTSAVMLFALHYMGGDLWGSRNVARPFAVVALIVAGAGMLNLKGIDIQGETNPHQIMKMRREEAEEELE